MSKISSVILPPDMIKAYTTSRGDVVSMVPRDAGTILDVGCSNGALGRALMAEGVGRCISGIEYDSDFVLEAKQHLHYVVQGDLNSFDWNAHFDGRTFDCIVFADVLEHLVDPGACVRRGCAQLRPGGTIVLSLPNIRHLSALRAIFISGRFPQRERGIFDRTHLRWFTIKDAQRLMGDCGLVVTQMSFALRWGDIGGGRMNRLLNRLPLWLQSFPPIREFLTYQVCMRAEIKQ